MAWHLACTALLALAAAVPALSQSTLTISATAQTGTFVDVGDLNPHSYRTNEIFSNDWVYEVRDSDFALQLRCRRDRFDLHLCSLMNVA